MNNKVIYDKPISISNLPLPKYSDWECHLFGSNGEFSYHPTTDNVPNWFWRWMQYICFGNRWVKK